ncbi:hypothetical protein HDU85_004158 [Gaertneriomyces sp. JEL0708]|nr:hypothetical protein HDU85_004158 [Gaertneriomyces sp. JEL0708]
MTVRKPSKADSNRKAYDLLLKYISERHLIAIRKQSGAAPPWTDDSILANHRFCNLRREDDHNSVVLRNVFAGTCVTDPWYLWNVITHRFISNAKFNEMLGYVSDLDSALEMINKWENEKHAGSRTWRTSAFQSSMPFGKLMTYLRDNWEISQQYAKSLGRTATAREMHAVLKQFFGVGRFHAYQATQDLVMYNAIPADEEFISPGPGALKGLHLLGLGEDEGDVDKVIIQLTRRVNAALHSDLHLRMTPIDMEHTLCEFQKYHRALHHGPLPRKYIPRCASSVTIADSISRKRISEDPNGLLATRKRARITSTVDVAENFTDADNDVEGLEEGHYVIETILDERRIGRRIEYLVRWEGYGEEGDTWEPYCNLKETEALDKWEQKENNIAGHLCRST